MASPASVLARLPAVRLHAPQILWGMAEYFAYPLLMFLATPFFLSQLGKEQYGQWMLMLAFTGFGGVAGLGMGAATIKEVSAHRGRGDLAGAAKAVRACFAVTLASSLCLAAVILLLAFFAGASWLSRVGDPEAVRRVIGFAAALVTLEQIDTVFAGTIRGMERFDVAAKIEMSSKFVIVLVAIVAAWISRDLVTIFWSVLAVTVLRAAAKATLASMLLKTASLTPVWDRAYVKEAIRFGKWAWVQSIGTALFSTADRLLIGSLLGSTALAQYSVCLQLAQQVHTVPAAGAGFVFPLVSRRIQAGENIRRIGLGATVAFGLFAAALATPLIFFSHEILELWIGRDFADQNATLLRWLTIAFVILALNIGPYFLLLGANVARFVALVVVLGGALGLLAGLLFIPRLGLIGAVAVRIVYGIITSSTVFAMLSVTDKHDNTDVSRGDGA
ncbi:MAG: hypothetical protein CTY15_13205 [Methylocystis sp.]|nr:MAG: hypothetical protein CTY15_13205 [Methylocystis sp.]